MSKTRGSNLVAAGILLSRVAGLARTIVLAVVLGGGAVTDAFSFAMRVPNLLQNLLGEGSLSASFIPVYAKLVEDEKQEEADAVAGAVVALLAVVTAVIVLVGVLIARPLVWVFTSWESDPAKYELAITLTRITTVGIGFLVLSAWCLGILNSHRSFFLSYVAPVIWNVTQIAVLVTVASMALALDDVAIALAWAVVAGSLLQLLVQIPRVRRLAPGVRPNLSITGAVRDVLSRFGPAVGARGVVQISSYADLALAGLLVNGALGWYTFALPLYLLPISLFGFSVAAAELAEMSRQSDDVQAVAERLRPALRRVVVPAGFVTAAYIAAAPTFVDGLYGWLSRLFDRGLDSSADVLTVALLLSALAVGLPATMTARVTQNTLYSLGDVRGPARIAVVRLVVSLTLGLILILQLDWLTFNTAELDTDSRPIEAIAAIETFGDVPHAPPWERVPLERRNTPLDDPSMAPHLGAVGLALAASVAAWTEWALLRRRLRQRMSITFSSGWAIPVTIAGAVAAVIMAGSALGLGRAGVPAPIDAVLVAVVGLVVYAGGLWVQGLRPDRSR
jgi:putative peptidoglycan lipid II flippase